jgi:hypothetical protein
MLCERHASDRAQRLVRVNIVLLPSRLVLVFTSLIFAEIHGSASCTRRFFSLMTAQSKDGGLCEREPSSRSSAEQRFSR